MSGDPFLAALFDAIRLGADLFSRPSEFVAALRRLGYPTESAGVLTDVPGATEVTELLALLEPHVAALSDGASLEELLAALELLVTVAEAVDAIASADVVIPSVGDQISWPQVGADVAIRMPQALLFDVIEHRSGWLVALLELLGLAVRSRYRYDDDAPGTPLRQSVALDTSGLQQAIDDLGGYCTRLFVRDGTVDVDLLSALLHTALHGLVSVEHSGADQAWIDAFMGGDAGEEPIRVTHLRLDRGAAPAEALGLELLIGPHRPGNEPELRATAGVVALRSLALSPDPMNVELGTVAITVPAANVGLAIPPGGPAALVGDHSTEPAVTLDLAAADPWRLFGGDSGPRVELGGVIATLAFDPDGAEPTLTIRMRELTLRLDSEGSDPFLANLVSGVAATLDLDVTLSRRDGIRINADPSLSVRIPTTITLGPITISAIIVGVGLDGDELEVSLRVDTEATIGPLRVAVADVGVALAMRSGSTREGFGFSLGLDPPDRIAFSFEAGGTVSGGGFLDIDHDLGRYSGGAALEVIAIGVSALTVIDTRLPGSAEGWALFASLGIDIPGIPIGFGFTLEGLGGLMALNRRIDDEALALGLRQGAVDAIMFPDDPVRDAAVLIPQIDAFFPIEVGNTVVGPMVEIGWGSPVPLITAQIGVMISLPQGLVVVMGSVVTVLPTPEAPLIELHMDTLGVIDLAAGTLTVTASLYDSRLLGVIELSGDMAFHLASLPAPYFALSIGGWHPSFQPPACLPSVFGGLRRIRAEIAISDWVSVSFENYLALTPNTVQFGGRFELEARVTFALATYSARGWFGFDVLLVFSPFKLVADVAAGVAIYSGSRELMGVSLGVHVEGPEPWFANGYATFTFFGLKVTFDFTVGSKANPEVPPSVNVLALMAAQLDGASSWEVQRAGGIIAGLVLVSAADASESDVSESEGSEDAVGSATPMAPDSTLVMRQTVAPLDRQLDCFGTDRVDQDRVSLAVVTVTDASTGTALTGVETDDVLDWFPPSQFDDMTTTERLASPSYELMTAGVGIGVGGAVFGESVDVLVGHETSVWEPSADPGAGSVRRLGIVRGERVAGGWFDLGATIARSAGRPAVLVPEVSVAAVAYHVVGGHSVPTHVDRPRATAGAAP